MLSPYIYLFPLLLNILFPSFFTQQIRTRQVLFTKRKVKTDCSATCTTDGTRCDNYSIQANYLWIDNVMKYCVIIYQSLVKTSNGLNEKLIKRLGMERVNTITHI